MNRYHGEGPGVRPPGAGGAARRGHPRALPRHRPADARGVRRQGLPPLEQRQLRHRRAALRPRGRGRPPRERRPRARAHAQRRRLCGHDGRAARASRGRGGHSRLRRACGRKARRRQGRLRAFEVAGPHAHGALPSPRPDCHRAGVPARAQGRQGRLRHAPRSRAGGPRGVVRRGAVRRDGRLRPPRPSTWRAGCPPRAGG